MATANFFALLNDDADNADPQAVAAQAPAPVAAEAPKKAAPKPAAKGKPEAVATSAPAGRGGRNGEAGRGGRGGRGRGSFEGRGGRGGQDRFQPTREGGGFSGPTDNGAIEGGRSYGGRGAGPRGRGGRFGSEEERGKRTYDRRSGTGRGTEMKRGGAGRGNWGTNSEQAADGLAEGVAGSDEKVEDGAPADANPPAEVEKAGDEKTEGEEKKDEAKPEEEEEDNEMTLDEYEKLQEEKRKGLNATNMRTVKADKAFEKMEKVSRKVGGLEEYTKLADKGKGKKKEVPEKKAADDDKQAKKSLPIQEFLKPAEGETGRNYGYSGSYQGGRGGRGGRGRGGDREGGRGRGGRSGPGRGEAPKIDLSSFPSLEAK